MPNTQTSDIEKTVTVKHTFYGNALQIHFNGYLTNRNDPLTIALYELNGKLLAKKEATSKAAEKKFSSFDISLSSGKMYLMQVQNGSIKTTQKMVIYR